MTITTDDRLTDTARFLADRGLYGMVWMDESLKVVERYGRLVDFVPIGVRV